MSTFSNSALSPSLPLTPPSNSETVSKQPKMSTQLPQTPQSPSQPSSVSAGKSSPTETSRPSIDTVLPTPAGSINGSAPSSGPADTSIAMEGTSQDTIEDTSNKRKRELEDTGDREQKKLHVEDRKLGIEDLHLDVGKKYLLCRTPHPKPLPDPAQDLFELYGLNEIAGKVARVLPNGEKNGLRKTYKGKIKDLGLSGKFDVVARDEEAPETLFAMLRVPQEEWIIQHRAGSELEKGISADTRANLSKAMTMSKGLIPKSSWDSSVLGELDLPEKKSAAPTPTKSGSSARGPISNGVPQRTSTPDIARPKRKVKQRSYGDASFEGYGEGYLDDEMGDGGYSTGEGDDRGMSQKRRKKNATSHNFPGSGPARHNSYGPGMVGA